MNQPEKMNDFEKRKIDFAQDDNFAVLIKEIENISKFIESLVSSPSSPSFGFTKDESGFNVKNILTSTIQSLNTIKLCCEYGNIADAYVLLKKYSDDLFYYLYVVFVHGNVENFHSDELNTHDMNIDHWLGSPLDKFKLKNIFKYFISSPQIKEILSKYKIEGSLDLLRKTLIDHVRVNGLNSYNYSYAYYVATGRSAEIANEFMYDIEYITVVFAIFRSIINPLGKKNETDSNNPYQAEPFIHEFLVKNKELIDEDLIRYLKETTGMKFD